MTAALNHRHVDADRALAVRVWWELRHARLRLAIAETELAWAQTALASGYIHADTALKILNDTFDDIEVQP